MCLGNISKDFAADDMKKTGSNGYAHDFLVDNNSVSERDNYQYFIGKVLCKIKFGLIGKVSNTLMSFGSVAALTFFSMNGKLGKDR